MPRRSTLVVRTLMPLVHALGRLGHSRGFATTLNAGRRPFHLINYVGACVGGQLLSTRAMAALLDHTINALLRRLDAESVSASVSPWPPRPTGITTSGP
jgi:hypothetical protein